MKITLLRSITLLALLIAVCLPAGNAFAIDGQVLVVSPDGPYTTINDALAAAKNGDTIQVHGGQYSGPLVVDKTINLEGIEWPVIDGNGQSTVVKLTAPGTSLQGFVIRNSGTSLDQENSGLAGEAANLVIENNRLEDTLFGIYLRKAQGSVIQGNNIQSKDLDLARRGDPIRVWYSNDVLIAENTVEKGRDVALWYSENLTVRDNKITDGRYGLHFMYCDDATISNNLLSHNSVGTFMMYSRRLKLIHNTIAYIHGPSGFGIGLKDMDDAVVQDNLFLANRVGAHLDNSPREVDSLGTSQGNVFAYNDIGINLMPSVRHIQFSGNSFIENQEQVDLSQPPEIRYGEDVCTKCSMIISEARFTAAYYTEQGDARRFDDIGGMFTYHNEQQEDVAQFWVHDYETEEWIKADQAFYVTSDQLHTPMGFGVVAFSEQDHAQQLASKSNTMVMSFDDALMSFMEGGADHEHSDS